MRNRSRLTSTKLKMTIEAFLEAGIETGRFKINYQTDELEIFPGRQIQKSDDDYIDKILART